MRLMLRRDPLYRDLSREMAAWRGAMDRLFDETFERPNLWNQPAAWTLPLDVAETAENFVIKASLPGANPDNFEITLADNVLNIKAKIDETKDFEEGQYHLRERRFGSFERSLSLAAPVNAEGIVADYADGVLTLNVPKAEEIKPKRIAISARSN